MATKEMPHASSAMKKEKEKESLQGDLGRKYRLMVKIFTSDPRYAKALAEVTQPSVHEKLSSALNNISYEIGASLSIIRALIHLEFDRKKQHPSTILRVNSIVSKMMTKYTKKVGDTYLKLLLGELCLEIYSHPEVSLETNPNNLKGVDVEEQAERNTQLLTEYCQRFFDRIIQEDMIDEMPRELRAICYFILVIGEQYKLNKEKTILPLISGFIMLRYICPCITLPNNCGITTKNADGNIRVALTAIAKVIQKLANGEEFEVKEAHLMPMNRFIDKNRGNLTKYLKTLPEDPKKQEGKLPFSDLMKKVSYEDIHLKMFNIEDLTFLHSLIYEFGLELISALQQEVMLTLDKRPISIMSLETEFLSLVHDLGPVEGQETRQMDQTGVKIRETLKGKSAKEIDETLVSRSVENLMQNIKHFNLNDYEANRFFYLGKPTKNNIPVFYLIMSRLEKSFLENNDKLMVFIYKTLWKNVNEPYIIVVDLSWAKIGDDISPALFRSTVSFVRLMKKEHLANCQAVYLLHPTAKTLDPLEEILNLFDEKSKSQYVRYANEWTDLSTIIDPMKIWIPLVSKKFIAISYNFADVSADSKVNKLVKITMESLLIIDHKNAIQDEIFFKNVLELSNKIEGNEIVVRYSKKDGDERETLRMALSSEGIKDIVYDSIFECAIRFTSLTNKQTFVLTKEKIKKGQKKLIPKVLKLSSDSILVLIDGTVIKREIPFSSVQSFYIDQDDKEKMYINFMNKGNKKSHTYKAKKVEEFKVALLDAINRFKFLVNTEIELFKRTKVDAAMEKFFESVSASTDSFDTKKFKNILKLDQPSKDLKKLFKAFNPDPRNNRANVTVDSFITICQDLGINMQEDEIQHVVDVFDSKKRGFITFDDIVCKYVFTKKEKAMMDKKKLIQDLAKQVL